MNSSLQPTRGRWWMLLVTALAIVLAWPPDGDRSLVLKTTNWLVDPNQRLPVLPAQLGFGMSDDPPAVEARDAEVRRYDELYSQGGWGRLRLKLKVAKDPFNAATERQVLLLIGVVVGFVVLRPSKV